MPLPLAVPSPSGAAMTGHQAGPAGIAYLRVEVLGVAARQLARALGGSAKSV